ncbi:MAG: porin [Bacteroidota bacterium]|nr:porin [Bacteroidota bacterium]
MTFDKQILKTRQTCYALLIVVIIALSGSTHSFAQRYLMDYDSTLFIRDTVRPVVKRFENLHFSGYIQPQFQVAQQKGISSFSGGNFSEFSDKRFMLRRARIKLDYVLPAKNNSFPQALFTFQFEATERDVNVRDVFVRLYEPKRKNFSLSMGLFARPYGFEVNLSSSYRESPERGRASQILMPSERDLGAMLSFESQKTGRKNPQLKYDIGLFNGQGKSGPTDFDSYKDLISRLSLKPMPLGKKFFISSGLSLLSGGWIQPTKYKYEMAQQNGSKIFAVDSNINNMGDRAPRQYYGADIQLVYEHSWGKTELRSEYWKGKQPGTATTTSNPGTLPNGPTYIRNFDAAFFYFLQNIINPKWEFVAKYDWYDPNVKVEKSEIGKPGTNLTEADVCYNTFGFGLTRYFTGNFKMLAYYDIVKNEKTSFNNLTKDVEDNVFTLRMQLRF